MSAITQLDWGCWQTFLIKIALPCPFTPFSLRLGYWTGILIFTGNQRTTLCQTRERMSPLGMLSSHPKWEWLPGYFCFCYSWSPLHQKNADHPICEFKSHINYFTHPYKIAYLVWYLSALGTLVIQKDSNTYAAYGNN